MLAGRLLMASGGIATRTFADNAVSTSDTTAYTFSGAALSTAAANRKIVVGTYTLDTAPASVSTLTVGGISATLVVAKQDTNGASELWQADVPTGTTGDVVVTWAASTFRCGIGVWAVYGAVSAAHATASNSDDPMVASLTIPAGGIAIGYAGHANGGLMAWTNLTENFDETIEGAQDHTGASDEFTTWQTDRSITANPASSADNNAMVLASWGPA